MIKRLHITVLLLGLMATALVAQGQEHAVPGDQLELVNTYLENAEYARADSLLQRVTPEIEKSADPELQAKALHLAGYLKLEQGDQENAQADFRRALQLTGQNLPADHPAIAQAHNDLGHYFFTVRQLDSAWQHHQVALAIRQKHYGSSHPKVADSYNNLGNIWQLAGQPEQALSLYEQAMQIRRQYAREEPLDYAASLNNLGNAYLSLGRLNQATSALQQSMQIRRRLLGPEHPKIGKTLQNLGIAFLEAGQLDSAEYYDLAALENARRNFDEGHPQFADLYENLGNCYLQKAQLDEAEEWYRRALAIRESFVAVDSISPAFSYLHLGDLFRQKGEYLEALQWTEKGYQLLSHFLPEGDPALADALEKIGLCHLTLGHLFEAKEAFTDVRDIRWQIYGTAHTQIANVFTNLGTVYWEEEDYGSAIFYYQEALSVWEQLQGDYDRQQARLYSNIGNSYLKEKNWNPALEAYREALRLTDEKATALKAEIWQQMAVAYDGLLLFQPALQACATASRFLDQTSGEQQQKRLLILNVRANILRHIYHKNTQTDTLYLAAQAYRECLEFLDQRQAELLHPESRQQTVSLHYDLFAGAIDCHLALWELERDSAHLWAAFRLSEVSKSMRLREKWALDLPNGNSTHLALARSLQVEETAARKLLHQLQDRKGVLAMFAGPEQVFWFFLHQGRLQAGKIDDVPKINELTRGLGQSITAFPYAASAEKPFWDSIYQVYALELYQKVWQPIAAHFSGASELVIVPDGALAYLPFPVLLTTEPANAMRYRSYPYLLQDYQISYAYSVALLARALQLPALKGRQNCLALAPTFEEYDQPALDPLAYNAAEVDGLKKLIGAKTLKGKAAGLDAFWKMAPKYRILHLATHGIDNINRGDYSFLAFSKMDHQSEGRLFVADLYQREIHADLVVMSACESGVGRYQEGEGVISLGRGFVTAGARSVVSTFWSVNDAKSVDFMLGFYRQLQQGAAKDAALRSVQQQYISEATQEDAHPFYWAAYFPVGDMSPLKVGPDWSRWWWLAILVAGGVLWFFRSKTRLLKNFSK
ncbi:MAG: CHAT domain-containing protein [Lewinella sp.]|nr:CHAT domain-containing protein [Lewinella sp.]